MPDPTDSTELELVRRAILFGRTFAGYLEWQRRTLLRIREQPPYANFTADDLKQRLCEYVEQSPSCLVQVAEKRSEYQDRQFYYKVIVPVEELSAGLFVEMILVDRDPDDPVVWIVNMHEQQR